LLGRLLFTRKKAKIQSNAANPQIYKLYPLTEKMKFTRKKLKTINFFLVIGMLISLFLLYEHFSSSASRFCTFGKHLDCGVVNQSPYANLDGISYLLTIYFALSIPLINIADINPFFNLITSNAFLGFLTLLFLFFLVKSNHKDQKFWFIEKNKTLNWLKGITLFGVIYGFYLFLVQHFILKTYCIFCLVLDIVLIALLYMVWTIKK